MVREENKTQLLQQEAYLAIQPPVDAQNSAILGTIGLSDTPLEPSFIFEYLTPRSYVSI